MLEEILKYLRNWFCIAKYHGTYTISDGTIDLPLQDGQYFRICGSCFSDGVYQYPPSDLTDETFPGAIWALAVPPALLSLVAEIEAWQEQYGAVGPYQSESFGGYTYSRRTSSDGTASGWEDEFAARLEPWRKI